MTEITDELKALLAQPPGTVEPSDLDDALENAKDRIKGVEAALDRLDREAEEQRRLLLRFSQMYDDVVQYRQLVRRWRGLPADESREIPLMPGSNGGAPATDRPRGTKRGAILELLADGNDWTTADMASALVSAGVMDRSDGAHHSLQVTLSRMYRKGELERPRLGVYRIRSREGA